MQHWRGEIDFQIVHISDGGLSFVVSETLRVEERESVGRGSSRALRRSGFVPAVLYGGGRDVRSLSVEQREVAKQLATGRIFLTVYALSFGEGGSKAPDEQVLIRDVQFDPVRDVAVHIDFQRVTDRSELRVDVPVKFLHQDICKGLKRGGILNVVRHEVSLLCRAQSIPTEIELDIADADIGDSLHASQAVLPEGVKLSIQDRDFTIATIAAPKVAQDDEETTETEAEEETTEEEEKKEE